VITSTLEAIFKQNKLVLKSLLSVVLVVFSANVIAQFSLVLNNDSYIVLDGGAVSAPIYVVITEPDARGITTLGTGGNIISEGEHNKIQWNIGTTVDNYVIPFTSNNGSNDQKIPLSVETTGSAVGASGRLRLSTWETDDMDTQWPDDVTHLNTAATGVSNGLNVVDRFWVVDADNYTTKPSALLGFMYNDNNEIAGSNYINTTNESTLVGQSFDPATNTWRGNASGTAVFYGTWTGARTVSGASVTDGDFFASWTLSLQSLLLPIELLEFTAECVNGQPLLQWATGSETNNDYFLLESSDNGIDFQPVTTIWGAGTSSTMNTYEFLDYNQYSGTAYFRLTQVDFDGTLTYSDVIALEDCNSNLNGVSVYTGSGHEINLEISSKSHAQYTYRIVDTRGRMIEAPCKITVTEGNNKFRISPKNIDFGVYYLIIENQIDCITKKLVLHDQLH
jgi:hypothetical protein